MPPGNRAACNRDEEDRPNWSNRVIPNAHERGLRQGHSFAGIHERRGNGAYQEEDNCRVGRIKGQVVRRLDERRCWEDCRNVEDHGANCGPVDKIPRAPRHRDREEHAQVDADYDQQKADDGDSYDIHLQSVEQLAAQDAREHDANRGNKRRALEQRRIPERRDEGDERRGDDNEVKQDKGQEIVPPFGPREFVRDRAEGSALLPDREHHGAVVLQPTDEEVAPDDPQERGNPTEGDADERAKDGPEGGDALELVAPEDVPTDWEILHPIHVHVCRGGLLCIGTPDVPVNPPSVDEVGDRIESHRDQNPQERRS
jgi:hypothetical protein